MELATDSTDDEGYLLVELGTSNDEIDDNGKLDGELLGFSIELE